MAGWPYTTAAWRNLRLAKLAVNPVCEVCELRGRTVLARAVDHRIAITAGGPAFPTLDGLMSMCEPCHNYKTNVADRPDRQGKLGSPFKGCSVDGGPIDPEDDWYA
jgi:5-methylcytosine-specific restriction endonuclease McrA